MGDLLLDSLQILESASWGNQRASEDDWKSSLAASGKDSETLLAWVLCWVKSADKEGTLY